MKLGINGRFLAARPTGVQRFALEVLRRATARASVTLLLPSDVEVPDGMPPPERVLRGRLAGRLWEQVELPSLARRASVDVVLHGANAAPLFGGPHVVVLHDVIPLLRPRDYRAAYRVWVRVAHVEAARRAAAVATVSQWSAGEITRLTGVPSERITVVPQGAAPLDAPASEAAVRQARERHGLSGPYFLAVTGGDRRKGRSFLDEVWKGWASGTAPELAVVGGAHRRVHGRVGGERGGAPAPAGKALGHVSDDDLRALYTGAVALLHPAAAEGFGRPPLEALACGTRVLAAPYGPAREVLGEAADLAPLDAGAWREAIDALLNEPTETRAARLTAGREQAAGWSWDEAVDALLDLCRLQVRDAR